MIHIRNIYTRNQKYCIVFSFIFTYKFTFCQV